MASRSSGASKLPKAVRKSGERVSDASAGHCNSEGLSSPVNASTPVNTPRVPSGTSRIPVPSRASGLIAAAVAKPSTANAHITGLRRPGATVANPKNVTVALKPLPTPPMDDSLGVEASKTTSPVSSSEQLHTRGMEVKGYPVGSLKLPTLVEGTNGIKSQHVSPIKNVSPIKDVAPVQNVSQSKTGLRKLPTAAEVILGLDESPPSTPTKTRAWPQRLSSLPSRASLLPKPVSRLCQSSAPPPKASPFKVAANGSPVVQTKASDSRVYSLRKAVSNRFSTSALGRLASSTRGTATRGEHDDASLNDEGANEQDTSGTSQQAAIDRGEAVTNIKKAVERTEKLFSNVETPEERREADKYLLTISLMSEAARLTHHVDLAEERVLAYVKEIALMKRMMAIHLREGVRRVAEKEKSIMKRILKKHK